jgi:hypothetical protein
MVSLFVRWRRRSYRDGSQPDAAPNCIIEGKGVAAVVVERTPRAPPLAERGR